MPSTKPKILFLLSFGLFFFIFFADETKADFLSGLKIPQKNSVRIVFDENHTAYLESRDAVYRITCAPGTPCRVEEGSKDDLRRLQSEWKTVLVSELRFEVNEFQALLERLEIATREEKSIDLQDFMELIEDQKHEIATRAPQLEEVAHNLAITLGIMSVFFLAVGTAADVITASVVGPQWFQIPRTWTNSTNMIGLVAALGYLGIKVRGWKPIKPSTALKAGTLHTFGGWSLQCAAFLAGLVP